MRLAKLQISGFKSFPDRAELGFDDGVTAIVGPNGCGKSNVVDAITWVLGEQSAKSLRGERMEDVIFNGSDARKPTAAAEVRLRLSQVAQAAMRAAAELDPLLDDQPTIARDIEIGRRLYRSGESEYLIDGEVCRLRDVHDLLMDSGLGIKAYAVIEQGKIGQILSSRPAERRALIEEAAGVTKYKSRRRAAELKLEAAQHNLTRIDDIIFEVEKQRGALRRQAARARRYRRLREELRRWEQVQFARRYEALARDIDTAEAHLADARGREAASAAHVAERETALEAIRLALTDAERAATDIRERAHERELAAGRAQQRIEFDRRQVDDLAVQSAALGVELAELEARHDPAHAAIEVQRDAAVRARAALEDATRQVDVCERAYAGAVAAVQAAERDADETRAAVLSATTTLSALRQARENAAAVRDRVAAERERLEFEQRDVQAELDRVQRAQAEAGAARTQAAADLAEAAEACATAERDLVAHRTAREQLSQAALEAERDRAGCEARLRSLEALEASRATFSDGARFLLGDDSGTFAQSGALADFLEVERGYERAVDALLGDLLQHVIVPRAADAQRALERAASENAGRCGLIVLEGLTAGSAEGTTPGLPGARPLAGLVRTTGSQAAALSALVGRAYVADTFADARALARTVDAPVATRAGEVCRGGAVVEGGSRRDARGILETRGDILALRDDVSAAARLIADLAERTAGLEADVRARTADLARHRDRHHDLEKTMVGLDAQIARTADDAARLSRRLEVVATERRRADEEERAASDRRDEAGAAIELHTSQQAGAEHRLAGVLATLQHARDDAETQTRRLTAARTEQATMVERASALDTDVARLDDAARELTDRIAGRRAESVRQQTRRAELQQAIADTERQLDEDVRALDAMRQAMRACDERVAALREDFGVREQEIRAARQVLETIRTQVTQSEVARATAAADLGHLTTACLETLNLTIDEVVQAVIQMEASGELSMPLRRIQAAAAPDQDEAAGEGGPDEGDAALAGAPSGAAPIDGDGPVTAETVIADLRGKIDRLGPVNMMAIEQFDELESRHAFLTTQRKDLLDSIAQTGEAIRKIDKTTRERFEEAFVQINTHFEQTFTTLFGGGRAGLVLIDQEHEAESGVDIIAQPPGKRLQNVQLLSGGEKALTAMALMFAIFKHRPSPFCLLDEIDAPLDDANIGRFVEMLQGMQDHTQFILITHNRKTMEIANRMYGVTMEEPGVSKLISVQLN